MPQKKPGRPRGPKTAHVSFRLSKKSLKNIQKLSKEFDWTKVKTIERALAFAAENEHFGVELHR